MLLNFGNTGTLTDSVERESERSLNQVCLISIVEDNGILLFVLIV